MNVFNIVDYSEKLINRILEESQTTKEALLLGSHNDLTQVKQASGFVVGMAKAIEIIKDTQEKILNESITPTQPFGEEGVDSK